ncbi:MAG: pimeloyl-ACP methyl ester carboxylesterase [Flavobacterium sp.]|jgi:pimeloyl-ACP methyl ester carboxylesterase
MNDRNYPKPDPMLVLAEAPRALSEMASLFTSTPFLLTAKSGDGHPVMVLPGLGASDRSTVILRAYLRSLGYVAKPWELGVNVGPAKPDLAAQLARRLDEVYAENDNQKVSLVGWSLGGVYSRVLAQLYPEKVRQVITLGSPFSGSPRSTNAFQLYKMMSEVPVEQIPSNHLRLLASEALATIPSTAIFSKTDGIVPWQIATQSPSAIAENIEVYASHIGLGVNASVLYAIADRLATPANQWKPFARAGWKRFVYGPALLNTKTALQSNSATVE